MNENLQSAIEQLITKTLEGVDTSVDFLQAELPEYVYQLLLWYGVYNFILFFTSITILANIFYFMPKIWEKVISSENKDFLIGCSGIIASIVGIAFVSIQMNLTWLQIWIAPKVWLVEYASRLVK